MHKPTALEFERFGNGDTLLSLPESRQQQYIRGYLEQLGAKVVIKEQNYFDRDFLAECNAFYASAARGYTNICRRLNFFSSHDVDRELLFQAAANDSSALTTLEDNYLGFIVLRPINGAPFGRTVLKWFPDRDEDHPRMTDPSRIYTVHLAGVALRVKGLAWQQQDRGVSACATIGVWTMLHSSAFDIRHGIPTTVDITRGAHSGAPSGNRMFPSVSLTEEQLLEAIKNQHLAPMVLDGDLKDSGDHQHEPRFSQRKFTSTCAALIRNGYPVLLTGSANPHSRESEQRHVMCAVGYRRAADHLTPAGNDYVHDDENIEYLYIHDDNIGPSVRFRINTSHTDIKDNPFVTLTHDPPSYIDDPGYNPSVEFFPEAIYVAVHDDIRLSLELLHRLTTRFATAIGNVINENYVQAGKEATGLICGFNLMLLTDYFVHQLESTLGSDPELLAQTRFALQEQVPPMSRYIGIIRIGLPSEDLLVDILLDTTDAQVNELVFAHVVYDEKLDQMLMPLGTNERGELGLTIRAFQQS